MYVAIIFISLAGAIAAFILYFLSKKFEVKEDPRIAQITELLPGANCGGCGYPGCNGFAVACVNATSLDGLSCPAGGAEKMKNIVTILGMDTTDVLPKIAGIRCHGTRRACPTTNIYDGAKTCIISASLYSGPTGCSYGCLGLGDCVTACKFDAITINETTGLPEISEDKCVACEACIKVCPKNIIVLQHKKPKSHRIIVACFNKDKGGVARKACQNACTGCLRCVKECPSGAITVTQNLACIDETKCTLCRKCVQVCTTGAILELNIPANITQNSSL